MTNTSPVVWMLFINIYLDERGNEVRFAYVNGTDPEYIGNMKHFVDEAKKWLQSESKPKRGSPSTTTEKASVSSSRIYSLKKRSKSLPGFIPLSQLFHQLEREQEWEHQLHQARLQYNRYYHHKYSQQNDAGGHFVLSER